MTDTPDSENTPTPDDLESLLGGLDFTPNWAKGEPGVKEPERRERSGGGRGGPGRGPRAPRDSSRRNLQGVRVKPRRDHAPRGHREGQGEGGHGGPRGGGQDRPYRGRDDRYGDRRDSRPPRAPRVPVHVDFIPEKKRLSMVVKVIRQSHKVFPLRVVAEKFMENPAFIAMKYTVKDKGQNAEEEFQLFVCRANGMVFTNEQACIQYVIEHGIEANYESTSKEVDPPAGNFVCIGRHRPSGRLIGPPNWHGYQSRLAEIRREVAESLPPEHFAADIEMVHEEEVIDAWKKEVSTQTFYREKLEEPAKEEPPVKEETPPAEASEEQAAKEEEGPASAAEMPQEEADTPEPTEESPAEESPEATEASTEKSEEAVEEAPPAPEEPEPEPEPQEDNRPYELSREQVEADFREKYLKRLVGRSKRTILPGYLYNQLQDPSLRSLTDYHLRREHQRPNSIIFALRPAFKHMRLHVYRYDGDLVVSGISQHPLPADQKVAPEIQNIVDYVAAHPGCNTQEALKVVSNAVEEIPAETVSHFRWLIEKGHLLEFHDDTLHLPHEPPKGKGGGKGGQGGKGKPEKAEPSPAPEAAAPASPPAPEAPQAEEESAPTPEPATSPEPPPSPEA